MSENGGPALRCSGCEAEPRCPFNSLGPEARADFESILETRVYSPGAPICHQGGAAHGLFILRSGLVRSIHVTAAGKPVGGSLLVPPALLGLTEVVTGDRFLQGAEAVEASILGYVPRRRFAPFLLRHPEVALALLIHTSQDLARLQARHFEAAGGKPLAGRLLGRLRELAGARGVPSARGTLLDLPLTVRDLAGTLGCSRQWASRILSELESDGVIERRGRRILLTEAPGGSAAVHGSRLR